MYTFYEYPKCSTCRRAKAELLKLNVMIEAIDIKTQPPTAEELRGWLDHSDLELKKLFNTSGRSYRELGLKDKIGDLSQEEAFLLLSGDGMLLKRPLLIKDGKLLQVGYRTAYKDLPLDEHERQ